MLKGGQVCNAFSHLPFLLLIKNMNFTQLLIISLAFSGTSLFYLGFKIGKFIENKTKTSRISVIDTKTGQETTTVESNLDLGLLKIKDELKWVKKKS